MDDFPTPFRMTLVVEYPTAKDAPPVGTKETVLGGRLIAVQFNDALAEIETLQARIEELE